MTGAAMRILMIEDNPDDAELVGQELARHGLNIELERVETEEELRRLLSSDAWDVIICDHQLRGWNGRRALAIVQEMGCTLPFIVVSGNIGEEIAVEYMRAGASDYVLKQNLTRLGPAVEREVAELRLREQARRSAARAEALARTVVRSMPGAGIFAFDRDLRYLFAGGPALDGAGFDGEALVGRTLWDVLPAERAETMAPLYRAALEGESRDVEHAFGGRTYGLRTARIAGEHGSDPLGLLLVQDITERKRMQAQVAQSDRLASMGMLAAGVAHEINNPLCYVLYNLQSLTDDLPRLSSAVRKGLDIVAERVGAEEWARLMGQDRELLNPSMLDDIRERFKDALHGTQRIRDIARGLGVFSRVERERVVPVALMHVIEVAINMVFNEIKYRARLVKEYGKTSTIMANDGRLSQVFLNLLINAAHAIPEGDVEGNEIRVRTWQEGDEVFAQVSDTGKGIASEHLPRLFEPFFTTKEIGTGTGLGLPISKTIVEEHGGRIEVKSELGKGTSFVVRLPVRKAEGQEAAPGDQAPARPDVRGRILVVDDEAGVRAAMVRMLKDHDVVEAASGERAKETLEADQAFDLILCDMMMPAMSGVDLHEWLEASHPDLARQVVFITGGAFTPGRGST